MNDHKVSLTYLSQEDWLETACFDIGMAMKVAEKTLLDFENHRVLFPEKIVQIFDQSSQDRINCLSATLLDDNICGVKWVSVFPTNPSLHSLQNLSAILVLSEIEKGFPVAVMEARSLGVETFTSTRVDGIEHGSKGWHINTPKGEFHAPKLVNSAGA